jgi:hypothetical protein
MDRQSAAIAALALTEGGRPNFRTKVCSIDTAALCEASFHTRPCFLVDVEPQRWVYPPHHFKCLKIFQHHKPNSKGVRLNRS